jgi:hypothetical protein
MAGWQVSSPAALLLDADDELPSRRLMVSTYVGAKADDPEGRAS